MLYTTCGLNLPLGSWEIKTSGILTDSPANRKTDERWTACDQKWAKYRYRTLYCFTTITKYMLVKYISLCLSITILLSLFNIFSLSAQMLNQHWELEKGI